MKRLMKRYEKKTGKPLKSYIILRKTTPVNKQAYGLLGLFVVAVALYILEWLGAIGPFSVPLELMGIIMLFMFVAPLLYIHHKTTYKLLITHDAIAKQSFFRRFKLIFIKSVRKVRLTKRNTLVLQGEGFKWKISTNAYPQAVQTLKTIFEYEGLFKGKRRPYAVHIEGGTIEVEQKAIELPPSTQRHLERLEDEYTYAHSGNIESIILYNAQIEKVKPLGDYDIRFTLDHIDIKPSNPFNTHFQAMKTSEASVVFEGVSHVEIFDLGKSRNSEVELLGTTLERLKKVQKGGLITDSAFKTLADSKSVDLVLMQGTKKQRVRFVFKALITGFDSLEERAWFEKD